MHGESATLRHRGEDAMKVHISADMEGTVGIVNRVSTAPPWLEGKGPSEYERGRVRMTKEVAAAVRGALAAGAEEVIVNDSHDGMLNLLIDELPRGCRLISGSQKDLSMMEGVGEPGVGLAIFTGYHAKAGTPKGILAHTYIGAVSDYRIDGVSVGEYGVNAAVAGDFDVPVGLVTGDNWVIEQVRSLLGANVVGAEVKRGLAFETAINLHPEDAFTLIEAGAREAVTRASEFKPFRVSDARVDVEWNHSTLADQAALEPSVERTGERTVSWRSRNGVEMMATWRSVLSRVMSRAML
jgi:D-amino peptidase